MLLALPNEPAVIVHETAPSDTLLFGQSRPSYQYWRRRVLYRQIAAYYGVPVFSTSELMAQPFVRAKALHRQDDHPGEDLAAAIACVLASELYRERLLSLAVGTSDAARTHGESTVDRESLPPALFSRDCELYDMSSSNRTERGWENFCNLHQGIGWWFGEDPNSIGLAMHGFNAGSADWQVRNGLAEKLRTDRTSPLATAFASVRLMPLLLVTRMQVRDTQRDVEIGVTFTRGYDRTWGIATMFAARTLHELLLLRECGERCVRRELDGHHEQRVTIAVIERVTLPAATVRGSVDAPAMSSELFACVSESGMPTVRANRREQGAPFVYVAVLAPTDGRKFFVWDITTEHCRSE